MNILNVLSLPLCQAILMDVPKLMHIILVDEKPSRWPDMPRGIMVHSMAAVQELGSKPENRKRPNYLYISTN